jgi:hypothetical protein
MRTWLLAGLFCGTLALPATAEDRDTRPLQPPPDMMENLKRAEEAMRRSMENAIESVDLLLRAIPQYELPQINEDGDIIIKRRRPEETRGIRPRRSSDPI